MTPEAPQRAIVLFALATLAMLVGRDFIGGNVTGDIITAIGTTSVIWGVFTSRGRT